MTIITDIPTVKEICFQYAIRNSISEDPEKQISAKVVRFNSLEKFLQEYSCQQFNYVKKQYKGLYGYFITNQANVHLIKGEIMRWTHEIMTVNKYNQECGQNNIFKPLKSYVTYNETLLIVYPSEKKYSSITETLTNEINECIKKVYISESHYLLQRDIMKRVEAMVQKEFNNIFTSIELVGSCKTDICFPDSEVYISIRLLQDDIIRLHDNENLDYTVYDVMHMADCLLEDLRMLFIRPIIKAHRCNFTDPISKLSCNIGTDDGLIYERDNMIKEYFKLDIRVKPLVQAVLYLVKCHKINRTSNHIFLSTTCYIFMVLRFLMCGLNEPVIPSLQNLLIECTSSRCQFNTSDHRTATFFEGEIIQVDTRYHDCVYIRDAVTGKSKNTKYNSDELDVTIWESKNNDNLGMLLIAFLEFYSVSSAFKRISIVTNNSKLVGISKLERLRHVVFVQDPFIHQKNIAIAFSQFGLKITKKKISAAMNLLRDGGTYKDICQMKK